MGEKMVKSSSRKWSVRSVLKMFLKLILVIVAFVCYLLVVPLFGVIMLPMYGYRVLVSCLQKYLRPDWVGMMSSRDAVVGCDDTTSKCECMIMALIVFKGVPDVDKCTRHLQTQMMDCKDPSGRFIYEKLTHYYENWMGFPFWKKEKQFKLSEHFRLFDHTVKKTVINGQTFVRESDLLSVYGDLETLPFKAQQSPWEVLVIPNYIPTQGTLHTPVPQMLKSDDDDQHFALVYRIHHALGDGYSCLKMLMCHFCTEPIDTVPKAPSRNLSVFMKIVNTIAIIVFTPYYHFKQFFLEIDKSHWHLSANKLNKASHFVVTESIPMDGLKVVGKGFKIPLTGVFLAGIAGGIHNFLKLTGKSKLITKYMRAFTPMPWENHPAYQYDGMANHWTAGIFAIAVGEDSTLKRLYASKRAMKDLVTSPILVTNFFTIPILLSAPNFLTDFWGTNWMTSIILSNFPGPKQVIKGFKEHDLDHCIAFVPHMRGSAGVGILLATSLGKVRCCLSIDTAILNDYSDAQFLISLIDEEFRIIRSLTSPESLV